MSERGKLWVQGIVAPRPGQDPPVEAQVQFRQEMADGSEVMWQQGVDEARAHAREVLESATNAAYEAAFLEFMLAEMKVEERIAFEMLVAFRTWRRDRWGQPEIEDWRKP